MAATAEHFDSFDVSRRLQGHRILFCFQVVLVAFPGFWLLWIVWLL